MGSGIAMQHGIDYRDRSTPTRHHVSDIARLPATLSVEHSTIEHDAVINDINNSCRTRF
jgi:hypothetical protein